MITPRDKRVIKAVGDHRILSHKQIQQLEFNTKTGYYNLQRRLRRELIKNKFLSEPFYLNVDRQGRKKPVFRLESNGKKMYKELTENKYKTPRWNINYIPHLLETNQLIISQYPVIKNFKLEYVKGAIKSDALCMTKNNKRVALEVDLSESEGRKEILRQFNSYEHAFFQQGFPDLLVFYSNRCNTLDEWIREECSVNLPMLFLPRNREKRIKLRQKIRSIS